MRNVVGSYEATGGLPAPADELSLHRSAGSASTIAVPSEALQHELVRQNEALQRAKLELEASRGRYFDLYDQAPVGYITVCEGGQILQANLTAANLLGVPCSGLPMKPLRDFLYAEDEAIYTEMGGMLFASGEQQSCELRMRNGTGAPFWARLEATRAEEPRGSPILRIVLINVSRRRRAEEFIKVQKDVLELIASGVPLQESLAALALAIEQLAPPYLCSILLMDRDGRHLRHGAAPSLPAQYCRAIDGLEIGPEVGSCGSAAFHKQLIISEDTSQDPRWEPFRDLAREHRLRACWSMPILDAQGQVKGTFAIYSHQVGRPDPNHYEIITLAVNIALIAINRDAVERALAESEALLREAQIISHLGHFHWDAKSQRMTWSDELFRIHGSEPGQFEPTFDRCLDAVHPEDQATVRQGLENLFASGVSFAQDYRIILPGGEIRWLHGRVCLVADKEGHGTGIDGTCQDISARRHAEEEREAMQQRLFQNQKYEALGTLAGGVAHDFNNILTGVINYTSLAREDCPASHPQIVGFLDEVLKCSGRAKELVHQILLFSRSEDAERSPVQLSQVIKEAVSLLRSTIPAAVSIHSELDPQTPVVLANASQIHQVIMNLGINAYHAIKPHGGRISIRMQPREVDSALAAVLLDIPAGNYVCVEIADTGAGMDPTVLQRIFEPFYTTKPVGEGTGLGLAVVRSVMLLHQGAIHVRSQVGVGTTFELYFPILASPAPCVRAENRAIPHGAGQHILLVDDEDMVVRPMQMMLERIGYQVTSFTNPEQALTEFKRTAQQYDVLISDLQMPGMTGLELAGQIRAIRPDLPVYIASGFAGNHSDDSLSAMGIRGMIGKPTELKELAEILAHTFSA